jgi:hypothetical protein
LATKESLMLFAQPAEALEPFATRMLEPSASHRRRAAGIEPTEVIIGAARCHRVDGDVEGERFAVMQLACSFLPGRDARIEWARFRVALSPDDKKTPPPIAVDLLPREVYEANEREFSLVLQPAVSFASADISLGSAATTIQKVKQVPVTVAAGLQTNIFYWQLEHSDEHPLIGPRGFYALVASPRDYRAIVLESSVVADIVTRRGVFRAATREHRDLEPLVQRVCGISKPT